MSPEAIEAVLTQFDTRSRQATQAGAQAFARLLKLAEERDSGQIPRIAPFLAATYNGQAFQSCSDEHDWNNAKGGFMRSRAR